LKKLITRCILANIQSKKTFINDQTAMSTHIFQSLEKLLFEQDTVVLPGFGGFTTTKTPATVDYAQGSLLPPSRAIAFNENLTINDGLLVQMLCRDYGMTNDQASHDVQDFVEKTTSALEQREIITLPGVGRLYKNYAQKVQFLPDNANFNTESYGLPPLQFSPIMRSREVKAQLVSAESNTISQTSASPAATVLEQPVAKTASFEQPAPPPVEWQPEESGFFSKYLPWMVGIAAVALAIGIWYTQKNAPNGSGKIVKTDSVNTEITIGGNDILPNTKQTAPSKPVQKASDEKGESRKNDDDADEVTEFQKKKQAVVAEKPAKSTDKQSKPAEKIAITPAAVVEKGTGEGRRAVIVVGTWADKKTAETMISLLEKNGWNSYFRKDGGWQVGIETTYKDFSELKNHLVSLEKLTKQENIWIKKK
jgi:nucleoid DNA-binding protein